MDLKLRSDVIRAEDVNTIYLARNLVCDKTKSTVFYTNFKPFYGDDLNTDFKITIRVSSRGTSSTNDVVLGCKYEGTLNGQQWPGFYIRFDSSGSLTQIGGYNYWVQQTTEILGKNLYLWRINGSWYAQLEDGAVQTLSVRVAEFNQPIVIGAGIQTNGVPYRYSNCVIDYIRIEYI